jgi:ribosome recycling factor
MEEVEFYLEDAKETMERAIKHTQIELGKIRAGKASAQMLDGIQVEYYGVLTPLSQVASISTPDARSLAVKPFERKTINDIQRAIINSNIGLSPSNDGELIRLNIPPMTEERRRDLVKKVKAEIETAKINIRNIRKDANEEIRKLTKDGLSEDDAKRGEERIQKLTDSFITKVETLLATKEADIMSV